MAITYAYENAIHVLMGDGSIEDVVQLLQRHFDMSPRIAQRIAELTFCNLYDYDRAPAAMRDALDRINTRTSRARMAN